MSWTHRREKSRIVQTIMAKEITIDGAPELVAFIASQRGDGQWVLRILSQDGQVDHRLFQSLAEAKRAAGETEWKYVRTFTNSRGQVYFESA